jgi:hypothetical protein
MFTLNPVGAGAVFDADTFQAVTDTAPVRTGKLISIFCTGLGELIERVIAGTVPGVYQLNVRLPANLRAGRRRSCVTAALAGRPFQLRSL